MATVNAVDLDDLRATIRAQKTVITEPRGAKATVLALAAELVTLKVEKRWTFDRIAKLLGTKGISLSGAAVRAYLHEYASVNGLSLTNRKPRRSGARKRRARLAVDGNPGVTSAPQSPQEVEKPRNGGNAPMTHAGMDDEA